MHLRSISGGLRLVCAAVAVIAVSIGVSGLSFASSGPRDEHGTTTPGQATTDPGQEHSATHDQGSDDHGSAGHGADDHPQPGPPAPKLGKDVVVSPAKGKVKVHVQGSASWHALAAGDTLPVGSVVDARHGRIALQSATDAQGTAQTGSFWGGVFQVRQGKDGATVLVLRGPRPKCSQSAHGSTAAASAHRRRAGAGLWGHDHGGRFRTRGRNSVATVRGTTWFVQERCGGTYTKVTHGAVLVRDAATHRTIVLRAGQSHLARPAHRRKRS